MRALAEFIMRGRVQATLVAIVGSLLPLISPATVALVSLRRGVLDGGILALWALLPPLLILFAAEVPTLDAALNIASVVVVVVSALVLRATISWNTALLVLVLASVVSVQLVGIVASDWVDVALQELHKAWQQMNVELVMERSELIAMLGYAVAVGALLSLLLGRWWQSMLYNPGGLGEELRAFRLPPALSGPLIVVVLVVLGLGRAQAMTAGILLLPLMFCGITLMHVLRHSYQLGVQVLVLFYLGILMTSPFSLLLLVAAGLLDSWFDFRGKLLARSHNSRNDQ